MWCEELTHWKKPRCWERLKQEEKGATEDEMVGGHHRLDEHDFEHTLGVGDGQGSLACCSPRGRRGVNPTEQLSNKKKKITFALKCWCLKARCSKIVNMRVCATGLWKEVTDSNKTNDYKKKCCLTWCSYLKTFNDLRGFKVDSQVWTHSWTVCSISSGL